MNTGSVLQMKPKLIPATATGIVPVYKSSKPAVVPIDKAGMITTFKPSKTTITVTAEILKKVFNLTVK